MPAQPMTCQRRAHAPDANVGLQAGGHAGRRGARAQAVPLQRQTAWALQTLGKDRGWSMTNVKHKDKADMLEEHNITEARIALACPPTHVPQ